MGKMQTRHSCTVHFGDHLLDNLSQNVKDKGAKLNFTSWCVSVFWHKNVVEQGSFLYKLSQDMQFEDNLTYNPLDTTWTSRKLRNKFS